MFCVSSSIGSKGGEDFFFAVAVVTVLVEVVAVEFVVLKFNEFV